MDAPSTPASCTAVYVSNADSGIISVLRLDPRTGALTPVQQVPVSGVVMPLALSPDRRFLYAARRSAPFAALSFVVEPAHGTLAPRGEAPLPQSMAYIATDRSGRFLLSASYGGDQIAVSPIAADGRVEAAQQVLATPPHAHAIQADASNRFAFATSLGGGTVLQFHFAARTGRLKPNAPPSLAPHLGASPRHFVFSPDARFVYVLGELDAAIDVLAIDGGSGTLRTLQTVSAVPPDFVGAPWAADLHLTPDGRLLYSSERRSSTLAVFGVDVASGALVPLGHAATEAQPRSFGITPDGCFLIAAGQVTGRVSVYRIDRRSGALDKCGDCAVGRNPSWIECVTLREA
jgi:6-phosphogluconolactonase